MTISIRPATVNDAAAIADIYNHYVTATCITFETDPVSTSEMSERISDLITASLPWLVAEESGHILGYAYATKWRARAAYRFSLESTVYLAVDASGKGIGSQLYTALLTELSAMSAHAVIGGIALPNEASIRLHERLGFKKVAHFEQVGFKQDRWIDVGYWQLLL